MNIRPKTKRRVGYLLIGLFLVLAAGGSFYAIRMHQLNANIRQHRVDGLKAYAAGDYDTAINKLQVYVAKHKDDPQALLALAVSRSKVPTLDGSSVSDSVSIYRKYCSMAPNDIQAKHQLLEIEEPYLSYAGPAISMANDLLKDNPHDLVALKALAQIYSGQRRYPEALEAALKYTALNQTDLELQRLTLALMQYTARPAAEMHARADLLAEAHPDDPRFTVLQALAFRYARDPAETVDQRDKREAQETRLLLDAAKKDPPDPQFVLLTATLLDRMQQFPVAQDLLDRASAKMNDPDVQRMLVERLWENNEYSEIIVRLKKLNVTSPGTDAELIAFKAMSLRELGQSAQANALVKALSLRSNEPEAVAWYLALKTRFDSSITDPKAQLLQYQEALQYESSNPYIQSMAGDAYAQIGETDLALQAWRQASGLAPSWKEPHMRIASVLANNGQGASPEAESESNAINRSNLTGNATSIDALITKAQVRFARLQTNPDPAESASLLKDVANIQAALPNEPNTLPIYAALLAQTGDREQAISVITAAEDQLGDKTQEVLLKLAGVSRDSDLNLETNLYRAIQKKYGLTPQLASAEAADMLAGGGVTEGLEFLRDAKSKAKDQPAAWDEAICLYREAAHDPTAASAWKQLGDTYPADLAVQSAIVVNQDSAWVDRDFMSRSIDRLKALTGEDAVTWKLGRARWLLDSPEELKDASAAVILLSDVIRRSPGQYRPHTLMATAYERLAEAATNEKDRQTNLSNAVNEWKQTSDLVPNSPEILYQLIRALHLNDRPEEARNIFDKLAGFTKIPPDVAMESAEIMAADGELSRAQKMLVQYPNPTDQLQHDRVLARVYRRQGNLKDAAAVYSRLLQAEKLDAQTIREAAEFFGAQRDLTSAHLFLDRLPQLSLPPGQREVMLGDFEEQHGDLAKAADQYAAAVKAAPTDPKIAGRQVAFFMRQQRWPDALASLDAALKLSPKDAELLDDKALIAKLSTIASPPDLSAILPTISDDPCNPACQETVNVLADAARVPPAGTLTKLQQLIEKYPDFQPLYGLAVAQMLKLNQPDQAMTLAASAMAHFKDSSEAARLSTRVDAAAGHWDQALAAARQWRSRAAEQSESPDAMIAAADLILGHPADAVECLAPYIPSAKSHPEQSVDIIMEYADALIRAGQSQRASDLLRPLAENSSLFRMRWLLITNPANPDAASALAWIDQVRPLLPADSIEEQKLLAETYSQVGYRFTSTKAYEQARDVLKPFVGKPAMDSSSMLLLASAAAGCDDLQLSEQIDRRILSVEPKNARAMNQLAELLRKKDDLTAVTEAESLARAAISADPTDRDQAIYLDTLARILLRQGRTPEAIATFEQAKKIKPTDLNCLIGLANIYARTNQLDKTIQYLAEIDALSAPPPRDADLIQELQYARQLTARPASSPMGNAR